MSVVPEDFCLTGIIVARYPLLIVAHAICELSSVFPAKASETGMDVP
jgi:hypothetical protein